MFNVEYEYNYNHLDANAIKLSEHVSLFATANNFPSIRDRLTWALRFALADLLATYC